MNDRVNEYIRAWIVKADNDLKNAELVLAARDENCFLSIQRDAEILTPYAVEMRYPDDSYIPSKEEAEEAYEIACRIRDIILAKMGEGFQSEGGQ
jgi:HEPN domain-containing protein